MVGDYLCRHVASMLAQQAADAEDRPTKVGEEERCTQQVTDLLLRWDTAGKKGLAKDNDDENDDDY